MAAATGWQISNRRSAVPSALEWRLLLSYLGVFVAILVLFAILAHAGLVLVFEREARDRLENMVRSAESVVDATRSGFSVDLSDQTIRELNSRTEGLRWSEPNGRVVSTYGLTRQGTTEPVRTLTLRTDTGPPERHPVVIEAMVANAPYTRRMRSIDLGIMGALLLAVIGSLVAGRWLTHRVVQGLETTMKTLQDFTADAAHELRGPLTVVATNAASAVPATGDKFLIGRAAMESITSATAQMIRVSEDLLTLARVNQSLERELFAVDLDACIESVVSLYREAARSKNVALRAEAVERTRVYGNPDQVERIISNLVRNAIQYTAAGGLVTIACEKERGGSRVTVTDSGPGIPAEDLERIFDRFWRGDRTRSQDGSGLGLTIARGLARRHGGDVTVTSRGETGSSFIVWFPSRPPSLTAG
jgi:signal transduction histidine kinase